MTAFAPNNTARLWLKYTSMGIEHELLLRGTEAATSATMTQIAINVATVMKVLMKTSDSFVGARFAAKGQDISFPIAWTPIVGTGSNTSYPADPESNYIDFVGRDRTFGSQVHWTLFSGSNSVPQSATNRVTRSASAPVAAIIDELQSNANNAVTSDRLVTISQGQPVVYGYANTGFNAYWQREQRT